MITLISLNWTDFICLPQVAVQSAHVLRINRNPAINTEQGLDQTISKWVQPEWEPGEIQAAHKTQTFHPEYLKRQKPLIPKSIIP